MVDDAALWAKYNLLVESYEDLPTNKKNPNRWTQLRHDLVAHATTEKNIEPILEKGLKPRSESFCRVWGEERVPHDIEKAGRTGEILQCRKEHTYFWDDTSEAIGQALATVSYLGEGDPAVIIVKQDQKSLLPDPELPRDEDEPQALMQKGAVAPEKVACYCTLSNEVKPDTGKLLSQLEEEKVSYEEIWEELNEMDKWVCFCKKDALKR